MKTLRLIISMILWVIVCLFGAGQPITWAKEGDVEYRFERIVIQNSALSYGSSDFALAPDGSIWIVSDDIKHIQHFDGYGTLITEFSEYCDSTILGIGKYAPNYDIALAPDSSVWLTENFTTAVNGTRHPHSLIRHYNKDGSLLAQIGNCTTDATQLFRSAVAPDGSLWVIDGFHIRHFNADGSLIAQSGSQGNAFKQFAYLESMENNYQLETKRLTDIIASLDGSIWILEETSKELSMSNTMYHLDANGNTLSQFEFNSENPNSTSTYTYFRIGMAIAPDGSIWVKKDSYDPNLGFHFDRIYHLSANSNTLEQLKLENEIKNNTNINMAIAPDGSLWLGDSFGTIRHLNSQGRLLDQFDILNSRPSYAPPKLTVAPDASVWIIDNMHGNIQKYVPRPKAMAAHPYKAVIFYGGSNQLAFPQSEYSVVFNDPASQVAKHAYEALKLQGFKTHGEIKLLTSGFTNMDLDNNGQTDDLQAATKESLRLAITDWASDAQDVVIFMVGQGGAKRLQINEQEVLGAEELAAWLVELEKAIPGKVTVVIEVDNSGSFLDALTNKNRPRVVIASTQANQVSNKGLSSFAYRFWSNVMNGNKLKEAFSNSWQATAALLTSGNLAQNAQLDSDGDAQSTQHDLDQLGNYCLGNCNGISVTKPVLELLSPAEQVLKGGTTLDLAIKLRHYRPIYQVWALVQRPGPLNASSDTPIESEEISLSCDEQQVCRNRYYRFDTLGQYRITFNAVYSNFMGADYQGINNNLSDPVTMLVTQPQSEVIIPAEYDDQLGLLYLYDVEVGGQHYVAKFQLQDGLFQVMYSEETTHFIEPSAHFDPVSNLVDVPLARAFGRLYQGSFKWLDNYQLQYLEAIPKP